MSAQHRHAIVLLTVDEVPAFLDQNPGRTVTIKAVKDPNGAAPESKPNGAHPLPLAPRERKDRVAVRGPVRAPDGRACCVHVFEIVRREGISDPWTIDDVHRKVRAVANFSHGSVGFILASATTAGFMKRIAPATYILTELGKTTPIEAIRVALNERK